MQAIDKGVLVMEGTVPAMEGSATRPWSLYNGVRSAGSPSHEDHKHIRLTGMIGHSGIGYCYVSLKMICYV